MINKQLIQNNNSNDKKNIKTKVKIKVFSYEVTTM